MTLPNQFSAAVEGTSREYLHTTYDACLTDLEALLSFEEKLREAMKVISVSAFADWDSLRVRVFEAHTSLQSLVDDTSAVFSEVRDLAEACEAELKACEGGDA